jgi:hypothetical protein
MCPRWGPKTERWREDWHERYDDDPDEWAGRFMDALASCKTAEARNNFLDAWYDVMMDEAADLFVSAYYGMCGTDLRAWYELIEQYPPEWHDALRARVATVIERDIREAALEAAKEPEAARFFRKYMVDKLEQLVFAYLEHMTQSEAAELANMALHSVWNTVWWLRKYADIDLWPGWP